MTGSAEPLILANTVHTRPLRDDLNGALGHDLGVVDIGFARAVCRADLRAETVDARPDMTSPP